MEHGNKKQQDSTPQIGNRNQPKHDSKSFIVGKKRMSHSRWMERIPNLCFRRSTLNFPRLKKMNHSCKSVGKHPWGKKCNHPTLCLKFEVLPSNSNCCGLAVKPNSAGPDKRPHKGCQWHKMKLLLSILLAKLSSTCDRSWIWSDELNLI
jgi:hypothetical protein